MPEYFIPGDGFLNSGGGDHFIPGDGMANAGAGTVDYDDGVSAGCIVLGGAPAETTTRAATDGAAGGGIVLGGAETSDPTNDHVDGTAAGGIVFGGATTEQQTNPFAVAITGGTYRISGVVYTLTNTMYYDGIGDIAALNILSASPATVGTWRYDLLSIDDAQVITVTEGAEAATPVMPATPTGEVKLDHVLRYYGQTRIDQSDIGKLWVAPTLSSMTATATDDELAWAEASTTITVNLYDQYGSPYRTSTTISSSFDRGNGTVTPQSRSTTTGSATATYTRDGNDPGDISPTIKFETATGVFALVNITLLDAAGDPMF